MGGWLRKAKNKAKAQHSWGLGLPKLGNYLICSYCLFFCNPIGIIHQLKDAFSIFAIVNVIINCNMDNECHFGLPLLRCPRSKITKVKIIFILPTQSKVTLIRV